MYKACIFDLDGTLVDTLESLYYSVNETMRELKLGTISREQCRAFVGNGAGVLIEKTLRTVGDIELKEFTKAMETYGRVFSKYCTYQAKPYDGIVELLKNLKKRGFQLAVLTNKPDAQASDVIRTMFGEEMFECVQGQCEELPRKPDPRGTYYIAEKLHVHPQECIFIGDSEVDIKTGLSANMLTVGVTWGFRTKDILLQSGAIHTIDSPEEFLELITDEKEE
ncbi:HAD family hydrolase [Lachnospiraceae bacterium LCP25S3_G4]